MISQIHPLPIHHRHNPFISSLFPVHSIPIPSKRVSISTRSIRSSPNPTISFRPVKCAVAVDSNRSRAESVHHKPFPAEVSRTIMELCSAGTLSTLNHDGWPLGIGVRFAVDGEGTPMLCLNSSNRVLSIDKRSSLHVQLNQSGARTPQCTIQGSLDKPGDALNMKKLLPLWKKKFGEDVNEDLVYVISVDRVIHIDDFQEDGIWVTCSDYKNAKPDPLRDVAERLVSEINANNKEDVLRFCHIYADLSFQVSEAKMVWVDRLGFDMRLNSVEGGVFEIRVPFPREVTDEKGVKSSFNGMSQIAWEVEKNYYTPDFDRVKQVKQLAVK